VVVTVKFVGVFRSLSGKNKLDLKLTKNTILREVIKKIVEELPQLVQVLANPKPNMLILVNGREISVLNGLETVVKAGDELVFVPVMHGG
jgi:molybdopterin synthase sulfur carrier subunit